MVPVWLLLAQAPLKVWNADLTIGQLAAKLHYSADPSVAGRHVAVFATRPAAEIARMVASCMGLKLVGTRFKADPAYQRLIDGYEQGQCEIAVGGIQAAVALLRSRPPRRLPGKNLDPLQMWQLPEERFSFPKPGDSPQTARQKRVAVIGQNMARRPEFALLLSKFSAADIESLLAGHFVVGSVPASGAQVALPGSVRDYPRFASVGRGYMVIGFDRATNRVFNGAYSPGQESPNGSTSNGSYVGNSGAVEEGSPLGRWADNWKLPSFYEYSNRVGIQKSGVSHGEILAKLASAAKVPVVAERMPWHEPGGRPMWSRIAALHRKQDGWLQLKPSQFWNAKRVWLIEGRPKNPRPPVLDDPIAVLDWAARQTADRVDFAEYPTASNREGYEMSPQFAKFWRSLSMPFKQALLRSGLRRGSLPPASQVNLDDAALETIFRIWLRGDVSPWFERSPDCSVKVIVRRMVWLRSEREARSGTEQQMAQAIRLDPSLKSYTRYSALEFDFHFLCGRVDFVGEAKVFRRP